MVVAGKADGLGLRLELKQGVAVQLHRLGGDLLGQAKRQTRAVAHHPRHLLRAGQKVVGRSDLHADPDGPGFGRVDGAPGIEHLPCALQADHAGQRIEQVPVRHRADLAERRVERRPVRGQDDVAGQGQPQTRAVGRAVDGGDHRNRQVAQQLDPAVQVLHPRQDVLGPRDEARLVVGQHLLEIAARTEHAAGAGQDDRLHLRVLRQVVDRIRQTLAHRVRQRVPRLRFVHREGDDPAIAGDLQGVRHHASSLASIALMAFLSILFVADRGRGPSQNLTPRGAL